MIITRLIGGLGNQMFQYAIARCLSIVNKVEFKMDITGFELLNPLYTQRKYELHHLNIVENIATPKEIKRFKQKIFISKIFKKIIPSSKIYYYYTEKKGFKFDPEVFKLKNIYLEGYWQTEKYFKNIEDVIRKEFSVKIPIDKKNEELLEKIKSCNSVAVHVRRGDYVTNPIHAEFHGTCGLEYYKKCVNIIEEKVKNPYFFIFSDDNEWTKKNLKFNFPMDYVTWNIGKDYEDLRLMSNCKHFIISNSSFGWWGAWLSNNSNKIVLAPKKWFKDEKRDTFDLIPDKWIRIS